MMATLSNSIGYLDKTVKETCFEDFLLMDERQLTNFQAKITYIGEQRKPLPTIVITAKSIEDQDNKAVAAPILKMRVAGLDFGNDDLTPMFCSASLAELSALIKNLANIPTVTQAGGAARYDCDFPGKYLALSLYNRTDEEYRLQAVIGQTDAKPLLDAMGRALCSNEECRQTLFILWRGLGFHIGALDPDSDGDGASDGREASWGTDPRNADTNGNGVSDSIEILSGMDPLNFFNDPKSTPSLNITEGPFKGSHIQEVTTAPDLMHGRATIEIQFHPQASFPKTDNLVFLQVFRRTAVKADGFKVPILPSLYIEYAGSPELDMHTIDGATVDHKVGELDPYYNGRDPHDKFSGALDKQHSGFIKHDQVKATSMIYRCRTYEEHWRALNPEGVREIRFDYETAAFCENGDGRGNFLGVVKWSWGKKRGEPITACMESTEYAQGVPGTQVVVEAEGQSLRVPVFLTDTPGQPSRFFSQVLGLWLKNHKYEWPGREVELNNGVNLVVSQPVAVEARVKVESIKELPRDRALEQQGLSISGFGREITGADKAGNPFPWDYFPFALPLTVTFKYSEQDVRGCDEERLGVVRFDPLIGRYTSKDLYILRKDPGAKSITFCASRFGRYAIVGRTRESV
jgi:hypothetical protein